MLFNLIVEAVGEAEESSAKKEEAQEIAKNFVSGAGSS
jgi:hypothetical protein